jgi:uncharacterized iron-regulated membrane protein
MSTTLTPPGTREPAVASAAEAGSRTSVLTAGFGPLLRRLHFYAGLLVAPFLLTVALTGLAFAFSPQLDQIAYHDQLHVQTVGTQHIPLSAQAAAAQRLVPGGTLVAVHLPPAADATTRFEFGLPELGENQRTVYIDPYSGSVRGVLTTWSGSTPVTTWLDQMHSNLNLGETGRLYSELAASWLWVLVLGGIILWWRHNKARRTARRLLTPETSAGKGVRRSRSWHATTGLWLAIALLFLSATGLTWSEHAGGNFGALRSALNSDSVPLDTSLTGTPSTGGGEHNHHAAGDAGAGDANFDAIAAAAAIFAGPITITPARQAGQAWTIEQTDNTWPVHRDKIAVNPATGHITDTVTWDQQPLLSKLTTFGIMGHMGILFGLPNQIVLAVIALGLITIIVWGYRMWWQRRPTRTSNASNFGAPPARGAWRQLPIPALVLTIVLTVVIGWAIPLLGVTLIAFLILDAIIHLARRTKHQTPKPTNDMGTLR